MKRGMTFGSLFSGIGGLDLGLERAGFKISWIVEIDPFCRKVLTKHWPNVPKFNDVRECGNHNLERVDLIAGGFPCQDISNAGKCAGINGRQSGLWSEFYRIIRELRPHYVLVENVASLLVRGMDRVLGDLASCGYDAEWQVLSACSFGAPHTRERVFVIAYPNGSGRDGGLPAGLPREAGQAFKRRDWWETEPAIPRVDSRTPGRVVRAAGNAVVPQVAEWIGRRILESV